MKEIDSGSRCLCGLHPHRSVPIECWEARLLLHAANEAKQCSSTELEKTIERMSVDSVV